MIIVLQDSGSAEIVDPESVSRFHVDANCSADDREYLRSALRPFAILEAPDHAWVFVEALESWPGLARDAEFTSAVGRLIDAAKKYGWFDEERRAIKAHIEFES